MSTVVEILSSHAGREKVIRTTTYLALLATGAVKSEKSAVKLRTLVAQLSACRTVLRLFDDLPVLAYTLHTGFGKQSDGILSRCLECLGNWSILIFFPVEHLAWASEQKLISLRSSTTARLYRYSITLWFIYLVANILRSLRQLRILQAQKQQFIKLSEKEQEKSNIHQELRGVHKQQVSSGLTLATHVADVMIAGNFMPPGFLWSGKLSLWQVGLAGTVSSLIPLARLAARTPRH